MSTLATQTKTIEPTASNPIPPDPILEQGADNIARWLIDRAVQTQRAAAWAQPTADKSAHGKWLPPHLFDGSTGVALFLAAWSQITRDEASRELTLKAVYPLRARLLQWASEASDSPARTGYLGGGFFGIGSFLYGLSKIAVLIDDAELAKETVHIADQLITPQGLSNQDDHELIGGLPGLLAALASVAEAAVCYDLTFDFPTLAHHCGLKLMALADRGFPGMRSGLGHGLSGMAVALVHLHSIDGKPCWTRLIQRCLAAEAKLFDSDQRSWVHPETRVVVEQNAWCHGAAGMLLARSQLMGYGFYPADQASCRDLDICLQLTETAPLPLRDHLCCGRIGRALVFDAAGAFLDRPDLRIAARRLGREVAGRCPEGIRSQGSESDASSIDLDPSLMNGLAGVGYGLLRLSRPRLPDVLTLESISHPLLRSVPS